MHFLEYLFFKYYNWAIKVGNGDMPTFASASCRALFIMLYLADILMVLFFFISPQTPLFFGKYFLGIFGLIMMIVIYVMFAVKGRDKRIMETHKKEWTGKKNLGAILFPLIAFVWFVIVLFLKAMINSGMI